MALAVHYLVKLSVIITWLPKVVGITCNMFFKFLLKIWKFGKIKRTRAFHRKVLSISLELSFFGHKVVQCPQFFILNGWFSRTEEILVFFVWGKRNRKTFHINPNPFSKDQFKSQFDFYYKCQLEDENTGVNPIKLKNCKITEKLTFIW